MILSACCPRCGEDYFICGFCNSELLSVEAVLLEESRCKMHCCSGDCLDHEIELLGIGKLNYEKSPQYSPVRNIATN